MGIRYVMGMYVKEGMFGRKEMSAWTGRAQSRLNDAAGTDNDNNNNNDGGDDDDNSYQFMSFLIVKTNFMMILKHTKVMWLTQNFTSGKGRSQN